MNIVQIKDLSKHYKVLNRREGLLGATKDLFSRNYKIIKAVDGISMDIEAGEMIGFAGPNGAGKSTTIKMMTGVLHPTGGEIWVNGRIPFKNRPKNVQYIGVVFGQRTQLWWNLPVIESFKILREIYRIDRKAYDANLAMFNELIDLKSLYSIQVRNLSLGQRMLCDIVASFLHNPPIIFLDEPTIGLDVSIKNKIRQIIKNLNEIRKTTIILTTHDIGDIEALCKRIIIIDKGKLIFDGNISRIHNLFGAYRTLKVELKQLEAGFREAFSLRINTAFECKMPVVVEDGEENWLELTLNQDELPLLDVLSYVMKELPVKDIKVEEMKTEIVIRKIYEGELR
jgi:ABC-2 type transport system ATP-binding protein